MEKIQPSSPECDASISRPQPAGVPVDVYLVGWVGAPIDVQGHRHLAGGTGVGGQAAQLREGDWLSRFDVAIHGPLAVYYLYQTVGLDGLVQRQLERGPVAGLQVDHITLGDGDFPDLIGFPYQRFRADTAQFPRQASPATGGGEVGGMRKWQLDCRARIPASNCQ